MIYIYKQNGNSKYNINECQFITFEDLSTTFELQRMFLTAQI